MVQQLRKSITALAFFGLSGLSAAQAPSAPLTLKPDAPDRYVVAPGDTLWGIASDIATDGDVRSAMEQIERLNALESADLQAGQKLRVPVVSD